MAKSDPVRELLADFLPDAQAIEQRQPRRTRRLTLYAVLSLVLTAILWASFSEIDKLVIGRGRLVTPLPNLVVQPLEPGILKVIEVHIGQVVRRDEVLATLDSTFAVADVDQLSSRSATFVLQAQRLESELQGKAMPESDADGVQVQLQASLLAERQAAYAARMRQFEETIQGQQAALQTNRRDQEALARHVQSLQDLESMHLELESKQLGSRANLLQVRAQRLEVARDHTMAVNRQQELARQITATEAERESFVTAWRQEAMEQLAATLQKRDEVKEQLAKAERRSELVTLTAPQDAIVLEIGQKSVGSVVTGAEPLFVLVPLNVPLEAEVKISPADVGEIRVGDTARIKIDAYPFQKHGTIRGKVINVSADAFNQQSVTGADAYYYLARLSLEDIELQHLPTPTRLLPGMTLSSEIKTGKRTVISYFLYPVIRVLDESLRER
ncbi:MAG: HlyD family type I secretion periplasmic adaptor subunit [Sulfitobacter sp.]|nr:HlyD family type I secretion periplasmic adaptor subunit [Sulfitobacter sp.]